MNNDQREFLLKSASKYVWWKHPNEAMRYPKEITSQIMSMGGLEDICKLLDVFSSGELKHILDTAEAGQFDERSWHFWHCRLSDSDIVPPMPQRSFLYEDF